LLSVMAHFGRFLTVRAARCAMYERRVVELEAELPTAP